MPFPNHHGPYLCYSKFPWCITPVSIDHPIIFNYNSPLHWLITKRLCKKGLQVPSEIEVLWKEQLWHRGVRILLSRSVDKKKSKKKRESSSIWSVHEIGDKHYPWNGNKLKNWWQIIPRVTNYPWNWWQKNYPWNWYLKSVQKLPRQVSTNKPEEIRGIMDKHHKPPEFCWGSMSRNHGFFSLLDKSDVSIRKPAKINLKKDDWCPFHCSS